MTEVYSVSTTFPARLAETDPASVDATVRDLIERWRSDVARRGQTPVRETVDVELSPEVEGVFDVPLLRVLTVSGLVEGPTSERMNDEPAR